MKGKDSAVRISLVDILYGVVLGYGFGYFDQANSGIEYLRFFFAYFIIIVDWIYVHKLYWGMEYKYNSILLLDIGVIFTFSRMLHTSTNESVNYFLWLGVLFGFYVAWGIISKIQQLMTEYDWRYLVVGYFVAGIIFIILWWALKSTDLEPTIGIHIAVVIIYLIALTTWFKKRAPEQMG
jgi:hypothetical protein